MFLPKQPLEFKENIRLIAYQDISIPDRIAQMYFGIPYEAHQSTNRAEASQYKQDNFLEGLEGVNRIHWPFALSDIDLVHTDIQHPLLGNYFTQRASLYWYYPRIGIRTAYPEDAYDL